jgi:hypothetical protein
LRRKSLTGKDKRLRAVGKCHTSLRLPSDERRAARGGRRVRRERVRFVTRAGAGMTATCDGARQRLTKVDRRRRDLVTGAGRRVRFSTAPP